MKYTSPLIALLLVVCVCLLGISPESFHAHGENDACNVVHEPGSVTACHLAEHHDKETDECKDHEHITSVEHACGLCQLQLAQTLLYTPKPEKRHALFVGSEKVNACIDFAAMRTSLEQQHLRGPPVRF